MKFELLENTYDRGYIAILCLAVCISGVIYEQGWKFGTCVQVVEVLNTSRANQFFLFTSEKPAKMSAPSATQMKKEKTNEEEEEEEKEEEKGNLSFVEAISGKANKNSRV